MIPDLEFVGSTMAQMFKGAVGSVKLGQINSLTYSSNGCAAGFRTLILLTTLFGPMRF
jgi:hypothetical protein